MKVQEKELRGLFNAMGVDTSRWNATRLSRKVNQEFASLQVDADEVEGEEEQQLLTSIMEALDDDEEIEVISNDADSRDGDEDENEAPVKAKKKAKKDGGTAVAEPKAAKKGGKKPPEKAGGDKGPGVIGSIVEFLSKATEKKPLSKKALVEKLATRFPDRPADAMSKTVNVQVPSRLKTDKGLDVRRSKDGYWIVNGD